MGFRFWGRCRNRSSSADRFQRSTGSCAPTLSAIKARSRVSIGTTRSLFVLGALVSCLLLGPNQYVSAQNPTSVTAGAPVAFHLPPDGNSILRRADWRDRGVFMSNERHYAKFMLRVKSEVSAKSDNPLSAVLELDVSRDAIGDAGLRVEINSEDHGVYRVPSTGDFGDEESWARIRIPVQKLSSGAMSVTLRPAKRLTVESDPQHTTLSAGRDLFLDLNKSTDIFWGSRKLHHLFSAVDGLPCRSQAEGTLCQFIGTSQGDSIDESIRIHNVRLTINGREADESDSTPYQAEMPVEETRRVRLTDDNVMLVEIRLRNISEQPASHSVKVQGDVDAPTFSERDGRRYYVQSGQRILGFDTSWKQDDWPQGLCAAIGFDREPDQVEIGSFGYETRFDFRLNPGEEKTMLAACGIAGSETVALEQLEQAFSAKVEQPSSSAESDTGTAAREWRPPNLTTNLVAAGPIGKARNELLKDYWYTLEPRSELPPPNGPRGWLCPSTDQISYSLLDLTWASKSQSARHLRTWVQEQDKAINWAYQARREGLILDHSVLPSPSRFALVAELHYELYRDLDLVRDLYDSLDQEARFWQAEVESEAHWTISHGLFDLSGFRRCSLASFKHDEFETRAIAAMHLLPVMKALARLAGELGKDDDRQRWQRDSERLAKRIATLPTADFGFSAEGSQTIDFNKPPIFVADLAVLLAGESLPGQSKWLQSNILNPSRFSGTGGQQNGLEHLLTFAVIPPTYEQSVVDRLDTIQLQESLIALQGLGRYARQTDRESMPQVASLLRQVLATQMAPESRFSTGYSGKFEGALSVEGPRYGAALNHVLLTEMVGIRFDSSKVVIDPLPLAASC